MADVPYQNATQVAQLLAERVNAVAYGQVSRMEAIDKQLASLGYTDHKKAAKTRAAAAAEETRAEPEAEPEKAPPQGRTSRPRQAT